LCQKEYERMWNGETQEKRCLNFVKQQVMTVEINGVLKARLCEAVENPETTSFPDFLFEGGFIEHFQITASKEDKKGSKYQRNEAEHKRQLNKASQGEVLSPSHSNCSYEYLKESLKRNWENHIVSLNTYQPNKNNFEIRVFMIEHNEMNIEMIEDIYAYVKDSSVEQRHFRHYSLSHDVEMLDYIYSYVDKIDYVIYRHNEGIEVIELNDIPNLKESLRYPFIVSTLFQVRTSTILSKYECNGLMCFYSRDNV